MDSGFDAVSLALFTTLAPAGVVAFIALAAARLFVRRDAQAKAAGAEGSEDAPPPVAVRLDRMMALPFSVVLIGFIASATHLGTPANALHVFSGIGRSPLSNEVLSAVAFLFLVGSYWMVAFKERFPDALAKPWLILASAAGIAFVACTSLAYGVSTVPTWDTWFTPANLCLSALLAGPVLGMLFLSLARAGGFRAHTALLAVAAAGLIAGTVVLALHNASLGGIANNEITAASLVPDYETAIATHAVLGAAGLLCGAISLRRGFPPSMATALRLAASLLVLAAVFATRIIFYELHLTVGF